MKLGALLWSFEGRISRGEFWLGILLTFVPLIAIEVAIRVLSAVPGVEFLFGVGFVIAIVGLVALLAVYAKRFHDRGGSGWWSLLLLVPILQIWALIECGFLKGMDEPNAYGPVPKGLTRKQRRLTLVAAGLAVCSCAAALILVALSIQGSLSFFATPTEIAEKTTPPGTRLRLGGLVKTGSLVRSDGLQVRFEVTDGKNDIPVSYRGVLPDLFREGQGVVAEGALDRSGTFDADTILAKHDENYMPKEVADALKKSGHWKDDYAPNAAQPVSGASK